MIDLDELERDIKNGVAPTMAQMFELIAHMRQREERLNDLEESREKWRLLTEDTERRLEDAHRTLGLVRMHAYGECGKSTRPEDCLSAIRQAVGHPDRATDEVGVLARELESLRAVRKGVQVLFETANTGPLRRAMESLETEAIPVWKPHI